jgi:hypothetical protein
MRILVLSQYFWPKTFRLAEVAKSLRDLGCEVTVLTGQPNYPEGVVPPGYLAASTRIQIHDSLTIHRAPLIPRGRLGFLKNLLACLPEQTDLNILIYAPTSLCLPDDRRIRRGTMTWPTENPILRTLWEKVALPRILFKENTQVLFCPGGVIASKVPSGCKTVTMFRNMIPCGACTHPAWPAESSQLYS